jgi:hypothetical protein
MFPPRSLPRFYDHLAHNAARPISEHRSAKIEASVGFLSFRLKCIHVESRSVDFSFRAFDECACRLYLFLSQTNIQFSVPLRETLQNSVVPMSEFILSNRVAQSVLTFLSWTTTLKKEIPRGDKRWPNLARNFSPQNFAGTSAPTKMSTTTKSNLFSQFSTKSAAS